MKAEQQSTEGIAGILATIVQEQGTLYIYIPHGDKHSEGVLSLELAGESDQLPQPTAATPSEGIIDPSASSGLQTPHVSIPIFCSSC